MATIKNTYIGTYIMYLFSISCVNTRNNQKQKMTLFYFPRVRSHRSVQHQDIAMPLMSTQVYYEKLAAHNA